MGVGIGPFHVAEEFTLQQVLGHGCAVEEGLRSGPGDRELSARQIRGESGAFVDRWPYSSSYMPTSSAYDRSSVNFRTYQSPTGHRWYVTPNAQRSMFGGAKLGDVHWLWGIHECDPSKGRRL